MPKDMVRGRVDRRSVSRVDSATAERLKAHYLASGDVVFARRGDVGRFAFVEDDEAGWLCGTGSMRVHAPDHTVVLPRFLRYALDEPRVAEWLIGQSVGSTMPNLNAKIVSDLPLLLPDPPTQRRIAAILSAFDELIEINERRIEVLEDLARSLYREWFVRFRFPGHNDVTFVDSELGSIPEAWRVRPTREVLSPVGGGTPSKKRDEYWDGGQIAWFTPSDLTKSGSRYVGESKSRITPLGLSSSGARLFPAGSVLMTSRATLGVLGIATTDATCNQGFIVIPPVDGIPAEFIYEWLAIRKSQLESIATGATFKEITKTAFTRFPFLLPAREVLARFKDRIVPVGEQLHVCEEHNRRLAATRDLLLPRLVTGRLDISDIDLGDLLSTEAA